VDIKFVNPVVFVKDVEISKRFFVEVIGLKIIEDHQVFILFENHFSIGQARHFATTVFGSDSEDSGQFQGRNNLLLYFETTDLEGVFAKLGAQVKLIHPIREQPWGQRVFRFYDPDNHINELGEPFQS
jgi:catechol 2,3-dioxygenase-like lactoylglutathione lyase family enzyme